MTLAAVVAGQLTRPAPTPTAPPLLAVGSHPAAIADGAYEPAWTDEAEATAAAEAAVEAWGTFATSGDFSVLEGHFDPAGPQFRQFIAAHLVAHAAALDTFAAGLAVGIDDPDLGLPTAARSGATGDQLPAAS